MKIAITLDPDVAAMSGSTTAPAPGQPLFGGTTVLGFSLSPSPRPRRAPLGETSAARDSKRGPISNAALFWVGSRVPPRRDPAAERGATQETSRVAQTKGHLAVTPDDQLFCGTVVVQPTEAPRIDRIITRESIRESFLFELHVADYARFRPLWKTAGRTFFRLRSATVG